MARAGWRTGMRAFFIVWSGQFLSQVGTLMTSLALAFWAFDITGRATELGLMVLFTYGPRILVGPVAGALLDRWNRRRMLIACDILAGVGSICVLALLLAGSLEIWHLYVLTFLTSTFAAFQGPGFIASASMMVPKRHYGRTSGLLMLAANASAIIAPALAGLLLPVIGLRGVLAVDIATFVFATVTLLLVPIPEPEARSTQSRPVQQLLADIREGLKYLFSFRGYVIILIAAPVANLFGTVFDVLLRPLVLMRTSGSEIPLATVLLMIGVGGTAGAVAATLWGGPKRKVPFSMAIFAIAFFLRAAVGLDLAISTIAILGLLQAACIALATSSITAMWQAKIPPVLQGRVHATRASVSGLLMLITMVAAGPLADYVFGPAMQAGNTLARVFGRMVGVGPGAGAGLLILLGNIVGGVVLASSLLFRSVRHVESTIPDHDEAIEQAKPPASVLATASEVPE